MRAAILLGIGGLFVAGPSLADSNQTSAPDGDKIICKTEAVAGSLIPQRLCMKKSDWAQGRTNARDAKDSRYMEVEPPVWRGGHEPIPPQFRGLDTIGAGPTPG